MVEGNPKAALLKLPVCIYSHKISHNLLEIVLISKDEGH